MYVYIYIYMMRILGGPPVLTGASSLKDVFGTRIQQKSESALQH